MAILVGKAKQSTSVSRVSEDNDVYLRATRDGALFTADWKQAMIAEGRGFMFNVGAATTPVAGGGSLGSVIDLDGPDAIVKIPDGTSILPMRVEIVTSLPQGAADDDEVEILLAVDQDNLQTDGSWGTRSTVYNLNTLSSRGSNCVVDEQSSASMTDPVLDLELAHMCKVFEKHNTGANLGGVVWTELRMLYEPETLVLINGPAMLCAYWGGTVQCTGFASIQWLELPTETFV